MKKFDFSGWATKANLRCSDGRTILKHAFKGNDGSIVPLVWQHQHNDPTNVLGHALLENREDGVYAYCSFNDTPKAQVTKMAVEHGDMHSLSIYANQLKQQGSNVVHGCIKEVSIVLAGANPGAVIDTIISHSEFADEEAIIHYDDEDQNTLVWNDETDEVEEDDVDEVVDLDEAPQEDASEEISHADNEETKEDTDGGQKTKSGKTYQEIFDGLDEDEKNLVYELVGRAIEAAESTEEKENKQDVAHSDEPVDQSQGGNETMKTNVFDNETRTNENVLCHADEVEILKLAKTKGVGSFKEALAMYAQDNSDKLAHGIDEIETLFPEYKDVKPGAPEFITRDLEWVSSVMSKTKKSPISRIRTRQADITGTDLRALGYKKGEKKNTVGNIKLLGRTTDPQTVYRKDALERDDIIDITDFDVVAWQYQVMKQNLNEELALAFLIGDGREDGDANKIKEEHIRSIWHDDELYTIHYDVDIAAAKAELQGTDTNKHFGENYIYAEAIVTAALYSREKYKGSGSLDFYCTPHLLNVMLLARDLNGRRIYDSKADLAAALNVSNIYTVEQFEGKTREDAEGNTKKLLGLFVNLSDYQVGCTKGGEITKFTQFDIDFNQEKYLIETRLSGALVKVKSAIALEEPVTA